MIRRILDEGHSIREAAAGFGVSERTAADTSHASSSSGISVTGALAAVAR